MGPQQGCIASVQKGLISFYSKSLQRTCYVADVLLGYDGEDTNEKTKSLPSWGFQPGMEAIAAIIARDTCACGKLALGRALGEERYMGFAVQMEDLHPDREDLPRKAVWG